MNEFSMNDQMTKATSSWRVFDDITYKRIETGRLTDYSSKFPDPSGPNGTTVKPLVAMAPCGGPIVFAYKTAGIGSNEMKYTIIIQNLPKQTPKLKEFDRGTIVLIDWTIKEDLVFVTEDGKYHIMDIFHYNTSNDKSITLSESVSAVSSASTFKTNQGTGLVALRKNQEGFLAVKDVYNPIIQTISLGLEIRVTVSAWCVIDHADITLVYAYDNNVATCSASALRREQQTIPGMTDIVMKLVASSDYQRVAVLKDNGEVLVGLKENIGQGQAFTLKYSNPPNSKNRITDIAWCGSDAIVGIRSGSKNWYDLLIIDGKHSIRMTDKSREAITNDTLSYTSAVWLSNEVDGIRIITTRTFDFFERLPDELFNIFNLLSTSPGSKLYNAYMNYKYENQTAEMLLKQLKSAQAADGLEVAVKQCIAAASHEREPETQKILLKSAIFGRSFLYVNLNNPKVSIRPMMTLINESCTDVISYLRLINDLQHMNISIPITYRQFQLIGTRMLIDRLLRRNLHDFATLVTKLLRMPPEEGENRILVQWAIQELINPINANEDALADKIKTRLSEIPGIPFIDIVKEAYKIKKFIVVRRLLDVKISLSDQIDMLLMLNDKDEALQKALASGDTDLALYVLMKIKSSEPLDKYMLRLQQLKSLPLKLHLQSLEDLERSRLHDDLVKNNPTERERIAYSHIVQRFTTALNTADQKVELSSAVKYFREVKNDVGVQLVDEEMRLISRQDDLEKKLFNIQLKGLSLLDTLEILLINSEKDAESLKKDFSIPDKRYWWVKIQAYAKKNAWTQLLEFGRKPTSPIGYEPFIDVCIRYQKFDEARRFADRSLYTSKLDDERLPFMYAKVQMVDEAIASALKIKSLEALHFIEAKCQLNDATRTKLIQARERLQENDSNLFGNVFKILNRGGRADV